MTLANSTSFKSRFNASSPSNSTFRNASQTTWTTASIWFIQSGNSSIAVDFQPIIATLKPHIGPAGIPSLSANLTTQCSGTVTKDIQKVTQTVTSTILVNVTATLYGNASTPSPEIISPFPACSTSYHPFPPHLPGGGTTMSPLLVTKKVTVAAPSPQTVGPIYNIPTITAQAVPAQPATNGNQVEAPDSQQTSAQGQNSAVSNNQAQPHVNQQSAGQSPGEDRSPGSAPLQQVFPEPINSVPSQSGETYLPQTGSGASGQQSNGGSNQQLGEGQSPSGGGIQQTSEGHDSSGASQSANGGNISSNEPHASSGRQVPESSNQASNEGQTSGDGVQSSGSGQTSSGSSNLPSEGQKPNGEGQRPGEGQGSESGGHSQSVGGQTTPGAEGSPSKSDQNTVGQTSSGQSNPNTNESGTQNSGSGNGNTDGGGEQSNNGMPNVSGGTSQGITGGAQSNPGQQVTDSEMIDDVPVAIGSSAIVVGSQTVAIGSLPTTVVANGEQIAVESSQIVAPGTTVPIEAAITPPPAVSTEIGGIPLVLQSDNIRIGSQTFSHGSSAAFAVYNGQTYSWDEKQLVGPNGVMVAFPSSTDVPPCVTAGGQVFSVYSSTLEAAGTNIRIPSSPTASPFVYQGQTFSINPSQLIAPDRSITVPPVTQPTPFVYNGQTFSIDNSRLIAPSATLPLSSGLGTVRYGTQVLTVEQTQIICPSTTIKLSNIPQPGSAETPSVIITGGLTFSLGPQAAVIDSTTYSFLPGQAPTTVTDFGRTVTLGSSGVQFDGINVPVPTFSSSYSAVTQAGVTFSVAPSAVILGSQTYHVQPGIAPVSTIINGQTFSIGIQGVGLASTTIPLPIPSPSYATVTEGDMTFSIGSSEAVFGGSTFAIGSNMPATMVLSSQTISINPSGIYFPGTTVELPTATSQETPVAVSADGLTFSVGPTEAIVGGTTYAVGSGAPGKVVVMASETISIGTNGIVLLSTTIPPEQTPTAITAEGLTFSADATEAIINGTAYVIGSQAIAKTIVVGSETIGLGTKGIVLPSTTIAPWGNETQTGLASEYGTAVATGSLPAASATTAPSPPTGLPGTGAEGTKNDIHRGAGRRLRPPDMLLFGTLLYGLISGLLGLM